MRVKTAPLSLKNYLSIEKKAFLLTFFFCLTILQKANALWTTPALMDFSNDSAKTPVFAMDSTSGTGLAAFVQKDGASWIAYARFYQIDTGWTAVAQALSLSGKDASNISVGYLGSGQFMIIYQKSNGIYERVISRIFNGNAWQPVDTVCNLTNYSAGVPRLSTNNNGNALVAWQQHNGTEQRIFGRYFSAGSWQTIYDISETANANYCNADVDVYLDNGGDGYAVFVQYNTIKSKSLIYGTRFNGSSWIDLACLSIDSNTVENKPKIVAETGTNAMVIYESGNDLYSVKYSGSWQTPVVVDNGAQTSLLETRLVHITGSEYMAIYRQDMNIWAAKYNGSSWETPVQMDMNIGSAFTPKIAFHSTGRGLAVFEENDRIYANWYDGTNWDSPVIIDANVNSAADPQIKFNRNGNAVVIFTQGDGTNSRIYYTEYYEKKGWDNASGNMNWNDSANWHPNGLPNSYDTIVFENGSANCHVNILDTIHSLVIESGYTGVFDFLTSTLTVGGKADFEQANSIIAGSGAIRFAGGSQQLLIPPASDTLPEIIIDNSADTIKIITNNLYTKKVTIKNGVLDITSNTKDLYNGGNLVIENGAFYAYNGNVEVGDSLIINAGATLSAPLSIKHFYVAHSFVNNGSFIHNEGRVEFNGSSGSHIINTGGNDLYRLRIQADSSYYTLLSNTTAWDIELADGTLDLGAALTHHTGHFTSSVGNGSLQISTATLEIDTNAFFSQLNSISTTGTIVFTGDSPCIQTLTPKLSTTHPMISHTGSGTLKIDANALSCVGFSQNNGTIDLNYNDIAVTSNNFTITNGTTNAFFNLDGRTIQVTGNATFNGQNGNLLNMNTAGSWSLEVSGTLNADYATIGNCNASIGSIGNPSANCVNSGGNTNWNFDSSPPANVGCSSPADNGTSISLNPSLMAYSATDAGSGLASMPYYFEIATDNSFTSVLQSSDYTSSNIWNPTTLSELTTYYWRVKAKDMEGNESSFCGPTVDTQGYSSFTTLDNTDTATIKLTYASYEDSLNMLKIQFSMGITIVDTLKYIGLSTDKGATNSISIATPFSWEYGKDSTEINIYLNTTDADNIKNLQDLNMLAIAMNNDVFMDDTIGNAVVDYTSDFRVIYYGSSTNDMQISKVELHIDIEELQLFLNRPVDSINTGNNIYLSIDSGKTNTAIFAKPFSWHYGTNTNEIFIDLDSVVSQTLQNFTDLKNLQIALDSMTFYDSICGNENITFTMSYYVQVYENDTTGIYINYCEYDSPVNELRFFLSTPVSTVDPQKKIGLSVDNGGSNSLTIPPPFVWNYGKCNNVIVITLDTVMSNTVENFPDNHLLEVYVEQDAFRDSISGVSFVEYSHDFKVLYIDSIIDTTSDTTNNNLNIVSCAYFEIDENLSISFNQEITTINANAIIGLSVDNGGVNSVVFDTPWVWEYGSDQKTIKIKPTQTAVDVLEGFSDTNSMELYLSPKTFSNSNAENVLIDYKMNFYVSYFPDTLFIKLYSCIYNEESNKLRLTFETPIVMVDTTGFIGLSVDMGGTASVTLKIPWTYSFGETSDTMYVHVEEDDANIIRALVPYDSMRLSFGEDIFSDGEDSNEYLYFTDNFPATFIADKSNPIPVTNLDATMKNCSTFTVSWLPSVSEDAKTVKICADLETIPLHPDSGDYIHTIDHSITSDVFYGLSAKGTTVYVSAFVQDGVGNWSLFSNLSSDTVFLPDEIAPENKILGVLSNIGDSALSLSLVLPVNEQFVEEGIWVSFVKGVGFNDTVSVMVLEYKDTILFFSNIIEPNNYCCNWMPFDKSNNHGIIQKDSAIINNTDPKITALSSYILQEDSTWIIDHCVKDLNNDAVMLSLFGAPTGLLLSQANHALSWRPENVHVGNHKFSLIANDNNGGRDTVTITLMVKNKNDYPIIISMNLPDSVFEDSLFEGSIILSDPDKNDSVNILISPALPWLSINKTNTGNSQWQYTLSGRPANTDTGIHNIVIEAKDIAGLSTKKTMIFYIVNTNDAPETHLIERKIAYGASQYTFKGFDDFDSVFTFYTSFYDVAKKKDSVFINTTGIFRFFPLPDGIYYLSCYVVDRDNVKDITPIHDTLVIKNSTSYQWKMKNTWNMISIPAISSNPAPFKTSGEILRWDESKEPDGIYKYYTRSENIGLIKAGNSYWSKVDSNISIAFNATNIKNTPHVISLSKAKYGWNQIASPFPYPVRWNNTTTLWKWNNATHDFEEIDGVLYPYEGYWVQTEIAQTVTIANDPYFLSMRNARRNRTIFKNRNEWTFGIELKSNLNRDSDNLFGISKNAHNEYDKFDRPEPPRMGNEPYLFFAHPEWNRSITRYASDIRQVWNKGANIYQVGISPCDKNINKLSLSVKGYYEESNIQLYINTNDGLKKLSNDASLNIDPTQSIQYRTLFVTDNKDFLLTFPHKFTLNHPYPNPVRAKATIKYTLPYNWETDGWLNSETYKVSMIIYDARGRVVRDLVNRKQKPGQYNVVWRGKSNNGNRIAAGAYICRLVAGKYSSVKKIIALH